MSDQYTRITCGGSALPQDAPVVGLLFGRFVAADHTTTKTPQRKADSSSNGKNCVQIVDADDIPTDQSETAKIQVSLHHAVFPQHEVVGWYRVGSSEEPTPEDLRLTQELKAHYYSNDSDITEASAESASVVPEDKPFFFSLLQVRPAKDADSKANSNNMKEDAATTEDEELPLNLYEVQGHDPSAVLVGVENWSLETSEAERIAVERVVREKPQQDLKTVASATAATTSSGAAAKVVGGNIRRAEEIEADIAAAQPSPYVSYMSSVQQSLEAMDDRIQLIIDYLERMGKGEIPPNPSLMRHIQGLMLQLGPLQQASSSHTTQAIPVSERDAELFSHLAAVAKTIQSVHSYTEKFRTLHDNRATGGRDGGRRGY